MQPLRSTDLLEVLDRAREMHAIDRALAILAFASPGLSWDELAALPLGERNRRLLALRAATFGPRLDIVSRCPACGEAHELEFVFPLGELPAIAPGEVSGTFEGRELRVRLPDSRDLAAAANARDAEAARRVLLERCAPGAGSSEALAAAFSALVEAHDPLAEIAFYRAIAAVTAALTERLGDAIAVVPSALAQNQRPGAAVASTEPPVVNVYLYRATPNAALRNAYDPARTQDGRVVRRPVAAWDLHYLITCVGNEEALEPDLLLGAVVTALGAEPRLDREFVAAVDATLRADTTNRRLAAGSELEAQVDLVRLTPLDLSVDTMMQLWSSITSEPYSLEDVAVHVRQRQHVYESWGFAEGSARGLGIAALFAGPSGTGKTMAAEVLARALRLDLVHVDLSLVVSKYIGETEKNLRRIFDAAEQGGAILLFDEADALFGRRSEVKDSHDRYANIEVSYLLQRMEAYRGLAILTTNLEASLDPAFLRRIRFVVRFPYPEHEQRAEIWRRIFPAAAPTEGLDPDRLGRLDVPGGNIRNIALHAAFLAAEEASPITMRHIADAARSELRKIGRTPPERELREWR